MFTPKRIESDELLDEHDAPRADMERSLRDLRRINRYLGGIAIYRRLLRRVIADRDRHVTVLDLGTGTSALLDSLRDFPRLLAIGIDFNLAHLLYERNGSRVRRVVADATRLPFRDDSVDVITSAHFFHHFSPDENVEILRGALRVTRDAIVINDTRRHYAPLFFVRLLGILRLVGRITRYDAPASVQQGYTIAEANDVARRSGASIADVVRAVPLRFAIILRKHAPPARP